MKNVIILRNIHAVIKSSAPPFFNNFSLSLKKFLRVVKTAMRMKLNMFTLQLPIYYILE